MSNKAGSYEKIGISGSLEVLRQRSMNAIHDKRKPLLPLLTDNAEELLQNHSAEWHLRVLLHPDTCIWDSGCFSVMPEKDGIAWLLFFSPRSILAKQEESDDLTAKEQVPLPSNSVSELLNLGDKTDDRVFRIFLHPDCPIIDTSINRYFKELDTFGGLLFATVPPPILEEL
ncbi:MAG: hypothetical protein LBQ50_00365 [Planctomycetaceae bacterium]|jgi:hypothetical protein|nr:hypothetical protein [Planctomycetaceae bacterium]